MFLVCGEAVIDFLPEAGKAVPTYRAHPAGSPMNVAIGLSRLGQQATFVTGLSRDEYGAMLIARMHEEGVATDLAPRTDHPTICSYVTVDDEGHPSYSFHHAETGADFQVTNIWLATPLPDAVRAIHLGGFPLARDPSGASYAALVGREAGQRFISVDPNIRAALMGDLAQYRRHFETLCPSLALIKASVEDIEALYPTVDAMTVARRWRALGTGTVVVTDGPRGAFGLNTEGVALVPGERVEQVVDTVGAGDTFIAALLCWLAEADLIDKAALAALASARLKEALAFANRAAAINCGRQGADPPRRAELAAADANA